MTEHERHQMRMEDLQREEKETVKSIRDIMARAEEGRSGSYSLGDLAKLFPKTTAAVVIFIVLSGLFYNTSNALFYIYAKVILTLHLPIEPTWLNFRMTLVGSIFLVTMLLMVLVVRVVKNRTGASAWLIGGIAGVIVGGACAIVVFVTEIPWGKLISSALDIFMVIEVLVIVLILYGVIVFVIGRFKGKTKKQRDEHAEPLGYDLVYDPVEEARRQRLEAEAIQQREDASIYASWDK